MRAESFGQYVSKQPFEPDTGHTDEGSETALQISKRPSRSLFSESSTVAI